MKLVHVATVPQSLFCFFDGQLKYMQDRGMEVLAVTSPGPLLENFVRREKIHVHSIEMTRQITPTKDVVAVFGIWTLLRRIKPQIVHAHTPKGGLLGMLAAHLAGVPVKIYHIHGLPFVTARGVKRTILVLTEKISCRLADRVLCVSKSLQELVIRHGLTSVDKLKTIGHGSINGIDTEARFNPNRFGPETKGELLKQFGIAEGSFVVGFLGRIVRDKGIDDLFDAWQVVREGCPEAILLMVGPVEEQDPLPAKLLRQLQDDPRVRLVGPVLDPAPMYSIMDLLVLPSHREGFGLAAIEASAMRIPVVASRIPGIVDAVADGVTGTLVAPRSPTQLAEAIIRYIGQTDLRLSHGEEGRRRVEHLFNQATVWQGLHAEYMELAEKFGLKDMAASPGGTEIS